MNSQESTDCRSCGWQCLTEAGTPGSGGACVTQAVRQQAGARISPRNWWRFYGPTLIFRSNPLWRSGNSTQSPSALTCVTTGFPRKFRGPSVQIVYRHIARNFTGLETKRTRHGSYRMRNRKRLFLTDYLQRQEGLPVALDELSLNVIDKRNCAVRLEVPEFRSANITRGVL